MADANAVISGGNYHVYTKAHASGNDFPADTVAYGTAWTGYVDRGYTIGGIALNMGVERGEIRVDQEFFPVYQPVTSFSFQMTTEMAEMTPANLQLASGLGTLTSQNAASGTRGFADLEIGATITELFYTWGFDIRQPDGEAFRVLIYKGQATGSPNPTFSPDNAATIALEISALVDTSTTPSRVAAVHDVIAALP